MFAVRTLLAIWGVVLLLVVGCSPAGSNSSSAVSISRDIAGLSGSAGATTATQLNSPTMVSYTVLNTGLQPISSLSASLSSVAPDKNSNPTNPFSVAVGTCTGTILPQATCNIIVKVNATIVGELDTTLTISYLVGTQTQTQAIAITVAIYAPPPAAVIGTPGDGQNTITWTAQPGATSYNIYFQNTPGVTASSNKVEGVSSPYLHTGLTDGLPYYYAVTSVTNGNESTLSSEFSATPVVSAPTNIIATAGSGQNSISWNVVTHATSYHLYWSTTPGVTLNSNKISQVASPYVHLSLTNGTTYYYKVSALDAGGEGPLSSQVAAMPFAGPPPSVTAIAGDGSVSLAWSQAAGATSYNIYYSTTPTPTTSSTKINVTTLSAKVTGLNNLTPYFLAVTSITGNIESGLSSVVSVTPVTSLTAPLVTTTAGSNQVTLAWSPITNATSYNLYWMPTGGSTTKVTSVTPAYTLTGLTNGTTYRFQVSAIDAGGEGPLSSQVAAMPFAPPPTNVAAVAGNSQATLSWTAATGATSYHIYYSLSEPVTTSSTRVSNAISGQPVTGLTNFTPTFFAVTSVTNGSESGLSPTVSATPQTVLGGPSLTATAGTGKVTLSWPSIDHATSYNLYWSNSPGVTTSSQKISGVVSPYANDSLTPDSTYYYRISALDPDGEGALSSEVSAVPQGPLNHFTFSQPNHFFIGIPTTVTITAVDAGGKTITNFAGTVAFSSTDTAAVLPPLYRFQSTDAGVHAFSMTFTTPGTQTVTIASGTTTNTSASFVVESAEISHMADVTNPASWTFLDVSPSGPCATTPGAKGDGINDDSAAIICAWNAATAYFKTLYFPPGTYLFSGSGPGSTGLEVTQNTLLSEQTFANGVLGSPTTSVVHVQGAGRDLSTILIKGSIYFIDSALTPLSLHVTDLTFSGGLGAIRLSYTTPMTNVGSLLIARNNFENYSQAALTDNSLDNPYWHIYDNTFNGANSASTMGVTLAGTGGNWVEQNNFLNNRIAIKEANGGQNDYITNNTFSRGSSSRFPRTDIWAITTPTNVTAAQALANPGLASTYPGEGFVISQNNFTSSGWIAGDNRLLYAAEDPISGTELDRGTRFPSMTGTTANIIKGHLITANTFQQSDASSLLISTTPFVEAFRFDQNIIESTSPTDLFENLGPSVLSRNATSSLFGVTYLGAMGGNVSTIPISNLTGFGTTLNSDTPSIPVINVQDLEPPSPTAFVDLSSYRPALNILPLPIPIASFSCLSADSIVFGRYSNCNPNEDDTQAFQQAWAEAQAKGLPLYIPPGIYRYTGQTALTCMPPAGANASVQIFGAGNHQSLIELLNGDYLVQCAGPVQTTLLKGFKISSGAAAPTCSATNKCSWAKGILNYTYPGAHPANGTHTIYDVEMRNYFQTAIVTSGTSMPGWTLAENSFWDKTRWDLVPRLLRWEWHCREASTM